MNDVTFLCKNIFEKAEIWAMTQVKVQMFEKYL